jgi:hypothetical protein
MTVIDARAVLEMLRGVPRPSESESINVLPLIGNAWLGLFGGGSPALFFELPIGEPGTSRTLARGVELIASSRFEILGRGGHGRGRTRPGYAIALRDSTLVEVFAAVVAHVASRLSVDSSAFAKREDVERYIAAWIEFFTPQSLSTERIVGLWGELYVLSSLPNFERGVVCWVGPYGQMFDFMGNGVSVEVKTSLRSSVASFSLTQIEGRDDGHSVFVRVLKDDRNGRSIDELIAGLRDALPNSVQFDATLARTGYHAGANAELRLTAEDVRAIPNTKVPRPIVTDTRIRSVRYEVDVDALKGEFVSLGPLFRRLTGRGTTPRAR